MSTTWRCAFGSPPVIGRELFMHSGQVTGSLAVNKVHHFAGVATDGQTDRPTTNGTVFNQRLLGLRRIDL